jgi:putative ABC transport system permease protein
MIGIGLAIGTLAALWATSVLAPMLFEVPPRDVAVFVISSAVLLAAGALAAYLPALRATRVDPVVALRAE